MKKLFIVSLAVFWTGTVAILVSGILMYSQTNSSAKQGLSGNELDPLSTEFDSLTTGDSSSQDIFVAVGTSTATTSDVEAGESYVIEKRTVQKPQYLTSTIVAQHSSRSDCWFTIEGKVYDVTEYIPFHPGGEATIIDSCGTDATTAFATKGGSGSHSASAKALLSKYLVEKLGAAWGTTSVTEEVRVPTSGSTPAATKPTDTATNTTVPATTDTGVAGKFTNGAAVKVSQDVRVRQTPATTGGLVGTATGGTAGKIVDGPKSAGGYVWYNIEYANGLKGWSVQDYLVTSSASTATSPFVPTTSKQCTAWTYNSWGSCQSNGKQTRTIKTSSPSGCTGGSPATSQSCTYTAPTAPATSALTPSAVATHNSVSNCWLIISNKVYNVTQYIPFHPGGQSSITNYCGKDATTAFGNKGGSGSHSSSAISMLANYLVGNLASEQTTAPTTPAAAQCTAWTYSSWGSCQSNGTQARTVKTSSPSGCSGGSPVTSQSCTYTPPVTSGSYTTSAVATHNSSSNCWLIISNKAYDVTQYIPFHPGGQSSIINYCGKDATTAFGNKGGSGSHSSSAISMLANYLVGNVTGAPSVTQCTSWSYSGWGSCQSNSTQSRSVTSATPSGCTGGSPVTTQSCTYTPPTTPGTAQCTDWSYSGWGSCQSNSTQSRTVTSATPSGCTGGSPVTSQSCTYTPPPSSANPTAAEVATHNSSSNCWLIISNKVYNVTQYIPFHPGGQSSIINYCGSDATTAFGNKGGSGSHSASALSMLANYLVGNLTATPVTPGATQCTSWSYSAWSGCQVNNTETRTVTSATPSGCTGGTPVTSRSCTYTPPTGSGSLTASVVATHNTSGSCWLIISGKVYDVTQYIPVHPGGQSRITNNCGKDSTTLFTTSGGSGHRHSTSATNLLANYLVGNLVTTPAPQCTAWSYSAWGTCQSNSTQSRTVTSATPSGCTGGSPVTTQSCTYTPPPPDPGTTQCTDWSYSSWGTCQSNSTQSRTVTSATPSGCTGGSPVTSQSCTYTPPAASQTYDVTVNSSGVFNPTSLTIAAGDSIRFTFTNAGDELSISFSPAGISSFKLDHERTNRTVKFTTAGTWTYNAAGKSGTVTVQ